MKDGTKEDPKMITTEEVIFAKFAVKNTSLTRLYILI